MVVPNKNVLQLAGKTGTAAGAELAGIQQQQRCASKLAMELSEKKYRLKLVLSEPLYICMRKTRL